MVVALVVVILLFISVSSAAPASLYPRQANATPPSEPSWKEGPKERGTFDLIISCLTTLFLSVWTAVHLNTRPSESEIRGIGRRAVWMVIAAVVPEYVLYCAFDQWLTARKLRNKINNLGQRAINRQLSSTAALENQASQCYVCQAEATRQRQSMVQMNHIIASRQRTPAEDQDDFLSKRAEFTPWTMQQAYFAVLGGFVADTRSFWSTEHLTLTPAGIIELAEAGLLPMLSSDSVEDKSKADALAKVLVLVQASWFLIQCLARLIRKLPLTLLELHTVTHIFCALGMYIIWFKKPYNVNSPHVCDDVETVEMAALFALNIRARKDYTFEIIDREYPACCQSHEIGPEQVRHVHPRAKTLDPKIRTHMELANRAIDRLKSRGSHFRWHVRDGALVTPRFAVAARSDFRMDGSLEHDVSPGGDRDVEFRKKWRFAILLSLLYGGTHLSAWTAHFPTIIEMWMWRASGISLVTVPVAFELFDQCFSGNSEFLTLVKKRLGRSERSKKIASNTLQAISMFPWTVMALVITVYPGARLYFLAESFAALRAPPIGTYKTIEWTDFIPHAS